MSARAFRFRVGADENGLGPRLGPMLTTAVLAEVSDKGHTTVERKPRGKMKTRLGDSKALVSHGDVSLAEAWARVLVERTAGKAPKTVVELVEALAIDASAVLQGRCPTHVRAQCWNDLGERFEASDDLVSDVRRDVDRLESSGVRFRAVRSAIVCTSNLNQELDKGRSRFTVDLHQMERLVLAFRDLAGEDVLAVLGKVGGFTQYEPAFGPLGGRLCAVVQEKRERSTYRFPGVGELSFVMDADDSDRLVSIASLVGKYLREALMARIVRHYREVVADLPDASGYHDPITTKFVVATQLVRDKRNVPSDCFERRRMQPS